MWLHQFLDTGGLLMSNGNVVDLGGREGGGEREGGERKGGGKREGGGREGGREGGERGK